DRSARNSKERIVSKFEVVNFPDEAMAIKGLNQRFCNIQHLDAIVDRFDPDVHLYSWAALPKNFDYLRYTHRDSKGVTSERNAAELWRRSVKRSRARALTYCPGEGPFVGTDLNEWAPFSVQPKPGKDVSPFLRLLDHLFQSNPEMRRYSECWMAYPLQNLR